MAGSSGSSVDIVINAITEGFNNGLANMNSAISKSTTSMAGLIKGAGAVGLAFAGIMGIKEFGESLIDVTKKYDSMKAALSATVGAENANAVFKDLQNFAKETPFSLEDVTTAYQRLTNLGLKPTQEAMLAYGNIAAGIPNKSIVDFIEAVADAVTGENERLKEFGITAKKNGDMVTYTFQGVSTTMKATKENIEGYLNAVGKGFANGQALSNQAATLGGRMSALSDTFQQFQYNLTNSTGAAAGLGNVVEKLSDYISYLNDLLSSGAGATYFEAIESKVKPLIDSVKDLQGWLKDLFPDDFGKSADKVISKLFDDVMSFIELMRQFFAGGGLSALMENGGALLLSLGSYINKVVQDGIARFKYFQAQVVAILSSIAVAVSNSSISAGKAAYESGVAQAEANYKSDLKNISTNYDAQAKAINDVIQTNNKKLDGIVDSTLKANKTRLANTAKLIDQGNKQLKDYQAKQKAGEGKGASDKAGLEQIKKQQANAKNNPAPASTTKKKKGSGSSAQKAETQEFKKEVDAQAKIEEQRYKNGELTAKQYYDNLLQLKLSQLSKENTASSSAYQKNLEIINSTSSTEAEKKKAIEANEKLQVSMTGKSKEELQVRQDIANQLKEANKQYQQSIADLNKQYNILSVGGETAKDVMADFNKQYGEFKKRVALEDKESGATNSATLAKVEALTLAQAKIADNQREINDLQAEYEATVANIKYLVASGSMSSSEGTKAELSATNDLNIAKLALLDTNLKIANQTPNYNKTAIAGIRQQVAEVKTAQIEVSERMKNLSDGIFGDINSAFSAIVDGTKTTKEIVTDLFTDLAKTITETFTKGWSEDIMKMFTSSATSGSSSGSSTGGLFSGIGSWLGGLFGGGFATGGTTEPYTISRINENGPEYLYTGSKPVSVMNAGQTKNHFGSGGSGVNVVMNITTKDANSMRQSQNQQIVEMQRNVQRQLNRNS